MRPMDSFIAARVYEQMLRLSTGFRYLPYFYPKNIRLSAKMEDGALNAGARQGLSQFKFNTW